MSEKNHSQRLVLFSVSGISSFEHFRKTIVNNVNTQNLSNCKMKKFMQVKTWGSIPTSQSISKWSKLSKGDIILFYKDKKYIASGILEDKEQNQVVAKQMWGLKGDTGTTWELILFMQPQNVYSETVPMEKVNQLLGYLPNFMPTRTLDFTTVKENTTQNLSTKYGSLKNALKTIGFSFSQNQSLIEMNNNDEDVDKEMVTFSEKLKEIPKLVKLGLYSEGKKIDDLETNAMGDLSEIPYKDLPVWHSKSEIDKFVIEQGGFSIDEIKVQYPSDQETNVTKIYREVEHEIRKLRKKNEITDWNQTSKGIWRLTYSELIPGNEKPVPVVLKRNSLDCDFEDIPLQMLYKEDLENGYEKISEEILISKDKIQEILTALLSKRHVLLTGPIGTGKTHLAKRIPEIFWKKYGGYVSDEYTATSDWSVQDVIGGIFPIMKGDDISYSFQNGCLLETLEKDREQKIQFYENEKKQISSEKIPKGYWLTIDEFNRADIDKAFGQLFTALRTNTLKVFLNEEDQTFKTIHIPKDFRIIGTLNTSDKTFLYNLSDALKSRFAYVEIEVPKPSQKKQEMYFAFKHALDELDISENIRIVIDDKTQLLDETGSDKTFFQILINAYETLSLIRVFKKLGTSILKTIYQSLIISYVISKSKSEPSSNPTVTHLSEGLDNAIITSLIPQLENFDSRSDLEILESIFKNDFKGYILQSQKSLDRENHSKSIEKILIHLQIEKNTIENFLKDFKSGQITVESASLKEIMSSWINKAKLLNFDLLKTIENISQIKENTVL